MQYMYNSSLKFGGQDECFMWLRINHAHKKYIYIQKGSCVYIHYIVFVCVDTWNL